MVGKGDEKEKKNIFGTLFNTIKEKQNNLALRITE
jgi:hypothetical protein